MIKSLVLKNFKSYELSRINFHKGVNVIIGEGLSGKSNIVRAISLLSNYNSSKNHKSFNAKNNKFELLLVTSDGYKIRLSKEDNKGPVVALTDANGDTSEFKTIGQTTPQEVVKALNIISLNIQKQIDLPLIIESSSSAITKLINKLSGIDRVDNWLKIISQKIKASTIELAIEEKESARLRESIEKLRDLPKLNIILVRLRKVEAELLSNNSKLAVLNDYLCQIEKLELSIARSNQTLKAEVNLKLAEDITAKIEDQLSSIEVVSNTISRVETLSIETAKLEDKLNTLIGEYEVILINAKQCPLCFSDISEERIMEIGTRLLNETNTSK